MKFIKAHGTGNDFIMIDNVVGEIKLSVDEVKKLCNRHFGIGADGVILVESSEKGDLFMNYINADGSFAEMCGNGTRCTAHFAKEILGFDKDVLMLETRSGVKKINILKNNLFTVNMGKPDFEKFSDFPKKSLKINDIDWFFASMGNPHAVGFFDSENEINENIDVLGEKIESDTSLFPHKINVNFVCNKSDNHFVVKTFERGAGKTLACGTGASASFAWISRQKNLKNKIQIDVPGGTLFFEFNEKGEILMTGPSEIVFKGEISLH